MQTSTLSAATKQAAVRPTAVRPHAASHKPDAVSQHRSHAHVDRRQGLCHISQVLELLFLKYGIEPESSDNAPAVASPEQRPATAPPSIAAGTQAAFQPTAAGTANTSVQSVAATPVAQETFEWFQPGDLTI